MERQETSAILVGPVTNYGKLFNYSLREVKKRITEIIEDWGIKKVIFDNSKFYRKDELNFAETTLLINPNITDVSRGTQGLITPFVLRGYKIILNNAFLYFDDASNIVRVFYDNNKVLADYYKNRNLIILYYNPFPFIPKIREFESAISYVKENINLKPSDKIDDGSPDAVKKRMFKSMSFFANNIERSCLNLKEVNNKMFKEINDYSSFSVNNYQKIKLNISLIENLEKMKENFNENFLKELEELSKLDFLRKVIIKEEGIVLNYGHIDIEHNKNLYNIGEIEAIITPTIVKFKNLEKRDDKVSVHPHIRSDGTACFGSFSDEINKLLANLELKKLAILLKQFLFSYNERSPINNISQFEKKQKVEKISDKLEFEFKK